MSNLERVREIVAENQRATAARTAPKPLAAQLDLDGHAHEIAPQTERMRLFDPAPAQLAGQTDLLADIERTETTQ